MTTLKEEGVPPNGVTSDIEKLKHLANAITKSGYFITNDGKVFSNSNWRGLGTRELQQNLNFDGYPSVRITISGSRVRYSVHKLVALFYLPSKPSSKHQICHTDGTKNNNYYLNLRWGTAKDNALDRTLHGRCKAAENGRKSAWKKKNLRN